MPPICCDTTTNDSGVTLASGAGAVCMRNMLRTYIFDLDSETYSDSRLDQILAVAQFQVQADLSCCTQVSKPSFCLCTDTPDLQVCQYSEFSILVALKAACIIDKGVARGAATNSSVSASCGPAKIAINNSAAAIDALITKGNCQAYEDLKEELCCGYSAAMLGACGQIVSIFTSATYSTDKYCGGCGSRSGCGCSN